MRLYNPATMRMSMIAAAMICSCLTACGALPPNATPTAFHPSTIDLAATLAVFPTAAQVQTATPMPVDAPPTPLPAEPSATAPVTAEPVATAAPLEAGDTYVIKAGDSLSVIAQKNNTSLAAIQLLNKMGDDQTARLGQKLKLPASKLADDEAVFWFVYVVKPGESIGVIAQRYSVRADDLLRVNHLAPTAVALVDQQLIIPVKPSAQAATAEAKAEIAAIITLAAPVEPTAIRTPVTAPAANDIEGMRNILLASFNQERVAGGLAPLRFSDTLTSAAQAHANDCVQRGFGSHSGSDGSTSRQRISRAGYAGKWTGENWAWHANAAGAFDMWFTQEPPSGPHRANIMNTNFSEVGFGIGASNGGYYFFADFGG